MGLKAAVRPNVTRLPTTPEQPMPITQGYILGMSRVSYTHKESHRGTVRATGLEREQGSERSWNSQHQSLSEMLKVVGDNRRDRESWCTGHKKERGVQYCLLLIVIITLA